MLPGVTAPGPLVPRARGCPYEHMRTRTHTCTSASLPAALADVGEPGSHSPSSHHPQHSSSFFHLKAHSLRTIVDVKNQHTNQGTNLVFLPLALVKTLFSKATWASPTPPAPLPWAESAFATRLGSGSLPLSHGGPPGPGLSFEHIKQEHGSESEALRELPPTPPPPHPPATIRTGFQFAFRSFLLLKHAGVALVPSLSHRDVLWALRSLAEPAHRVPPLGQRGALRSLSPSPSCGRPGPRL